MRITTLLAYALKRLKKRVASFCLLLAVLALLACGGLCSLSGFVLSLLKL